MPAASAAMEGSELLKRVIVAVVCIPILLAMVYVAPVWMLPAAVALLSAIAIYEALYSTNFLRHSRITAYSILLAGLIPFWVFYDSRSLPALVGLFVYVVLIFCDAMASHKKVGLEKIGGAFFLSVFIPFFLSSFLRMRKLEDWKYYIILPFVIAFLSDACALFAGLAFGKHKLAPELSPKKTVEGAIGGVCGATAAAVLSGVLAGPLFGVEGCRLWVLAIYGVAGSILSQLGDLSFSYIKREYGLKDFGDLFPGHGGVLDRFDSVLFCAPFVEIMLYILPVVK